MSELAVPEPSKAEAIEFTANLRDKFENLCDAVEEVAKDLKTSQEIPYWKSAGYDSWLDWYQTEYEDQLDFLKETKLSIDARFDLVGTLASGGMSNRAIASTLGVNEKTVRNDLRASRDMDAEFSASKGVDAPGQSVEQVGHIDEPERQSLTVPTGEQLVIGNEVVVDNANNGEGDPFADRFAGIDFGAMIISPPPQQIIQAEPSEDTPDYFVPRSVAPSWSPPVVGELPPPADKAYHDAPEPSPEFLEPPMKLQKAGEANKTPEEKHCRTCACNLLP